MLLCFLLVRVQPKKFRITPILAQLDPCNYYHYYFAFLKWHFWDVMLPYPIFHVCAIDLSQNIGLNPRHHWDNPHSEGCREILFLPLQTPWLHYSYLCFRVLSFPPLSKARCSSKSLPWGHLLASRARSDCQDKSLTCITSVNIVLQCKVITTAIDNALPT